MALNDLILDSSTLLYHRAMLNLTASLIVFLWKTKKKSPLNIYCPIIYLKSTHLLALESNYICTFAHYF